MYNFKILSTTTKKHDFTFSAKDFEITSVTRMMIGTAFVKAADEVPCTVLPIAYILDKRPLMEDPREIMFYIEFESGISLAINMICQAHWELPHRSHATRKCFDTYEEAEKALKDDPRREFIKKVSYTAAA